MRTGTLPGFVASLVCRKGGFYTPHTVFTLLVNTPDPAQDAEICDPAVGSGGMLIESFNYVESKYGSARKLTLHGQEKNGMPQVLSWQGI